MNKANFVIRAIPDQISTPYAIRASRRNTAIPHTWKSQAAPAHAANACAPSKSAKRTESCSPTIHSMGSIHTRHRARSSSTKPHAPHTRRKINSQTAFVRCRSCSKATGAIAG